jgi:hypothetical protein
MALAGVGRRLEVSDEDRVELERIVRAAGSEMRMVKRARIVPRSQTQTRMDCARA